MIIWKLKKGADKRIRSGHPWVFSNELAQSPKGVEPGALIELHDFTGKRVAWGYGNPNSLIAFRTLDTQFQNPNSAEPSTDFVNAAKEQGLDLQNISQVTEWLANKLYAAWRFRYKLGIQGSFRLCFGEGDNLPGIVVDYYLVRGKSGIQSQVFSVQVLTAGMEKIVGDISELFHLLVLKANENKISRVTWENTGVVIRNDVNVRKLEGLNVDESKVAKKPSDPDLDLNNIKILLTAKASLITIQNGDKNSTPMASGSEVENSNSMTAHSGDANTSHLNGFIEMSCDLINGQKTGFFLDQTHNIELIVNLLNRYMISKDSSSPVRILDLCCYVGHWSTQLSYLFKKLNIPVEVTLVDVSETALAFAKQNAAQFASKVIVEKRDVLKELDTLDKNKYDIVIADPPAFIKSKKDIHNGKHAYMKFNQSAFELAKPSGLVVSCSCSALIEEDEFKDAIRKALQRSGKRGSCILRGGHAPDHPTKLSFAEGTYLKMHTHQLI